RSDILNGLSAMASALPLRPVLAPVAPGLPPSAAKKREFPALTSLRFIAAFLVVLFHFFPESGFVAGEGHVGVGIFFVLSGFLITLRYGDGIARGEVALGGYFLRR